MHSAVQIAAASCPPVTHRKRSKATATGAGSGSAAEQDPIKDTTQTMTDELRALAAEQAGLPPEAAERLRGDTLAELSKDAEALASAMGLKAPEPEQDPLDAWRALAKSDPERFCELTEGDVDLSKPPPSGASLT